MHISYPLLDYSYDYFVKYFKIFKKYMYIYIYIYGGSVVQNGPKSSKS